VDLSTPYLNLVFEMPAALLFDSVAIPVVIFFLFLFVQILFLKPEISKKLSPLSLLGVSIAVYAYLVFMVHDVGLGIAMPFITGVSVTLFTDTRWHLGNFSKDREFDGSLFEVLVIGAYAFGIVMSMRFGIAVGCVAGLLSFFALILGSLLGLMLGFLGMFSQSVGVLAQSRLAKLGRWLAAKNVEASQK